MDVLLEGRLEVLRDAVKNVTKMKAMDITKSLPTREEL
jgi:hypothetical protein